MARVILARRVARLEAGAVEIELRREAHRVANELGIDQAELLERARQLVRRQEELQKTGFSRVEAYRAYAEEQGLDPEQLLAADS